MNESRKLFFNKFTNEVTINIFMLDSFLMRGWKGLKTRYMVNFLSQKNIVVSF